MLELHEAVIKGDLKRIEELKKAGININTQDNKGMTVLHYACLYGKDNLIEPLTNMGANINAVDNKFKKPIFYAAKVGSVDTIDKLINAGAKPEYGIFGTAYWLITQGNLSGINKFPAWEINIHHDPLLLYAYESGQLRAIQALETLGAKLAPREISKEELFFTFGGKKIEHFFNYKGGVGKLALGSLLYYLSKYFLEKTQRHEIDNTTAEKVCTRLRKLYESQNSTKEMIKKFQEENVIDIEIKSKEHLVIISLQKVSQPGEKINLFVIDKTALNRFIRTKDAKKQPGIQVISLQNDEQLLTTIIDKLKSLEECPYEKLEEFILSEIPKLCNNTYYIAKDYMSSIPKSQSCFFSNIKLYFEKIIFDVFGIQSGLKIYKDFTLYFREHIMEDFLKTNTPTKMDEIKFYNDLEISLKTIIAEKKEKLTEVENLSERQQEIKPQF